MKKFLQNKKLLTAVVVVIAIFAVLGGSVSLSKKRGTPPLIQSFGNDVVSIGSRIVDAPVRLISGGLNNVHDLLNVQAENDHLKQKIDNLGQTEARNNSLEKENKQLKAALKLQSTLTDYKMINASVISRAPDSWSSLLTINKGSTSGIRKNMAVMCAGGVIGRIAEADAATAKVELLTTTSTSVNHFAVEADAANGEAVHGIITADENSELFFTQVIDSNKLKRGTKVYTSGMGGNSPKGLLIGTVSKATRDSFGVSNLIKIVPAGEINDPTVVTVIKKKVSE